ncbi:MAG: YceI family protein [Crocinitomicaceae bacterium]|jgi:polyisoprenoid-binding protein YceI|nr:YceI family protein [Crocinitomicaceae bacterium]MCF8444738.1 YceI family protein [Crocinitomicaceae bacterium]
METNWKIDNMHSVIGFKVRHMMISNITGSFGDFNADATVLNDDFSSAKFDFEASIDSINTGVADRDGHLKSADFFDSASYPKLTFHSESITKKSDSDFEVSGIMNIKGVEKPVVLSMEYAGIAVDPYGQTKAGMSLTGKVKRSDFGLTWNAVTEAGSIVLADDIQLNCEIQLVKN